MGEGIKSVTLYELNSRVKNLLKRELYETVWLQAELSEVRESKGHCYLNFVQKNDEGSSVARADGVIWKEKWNMLQPYFQTVTGKALCAGMQVLVEVEVTFHEWFGYKLNVLDIDPTYTIGDIERRRREILQKLEEEGVAQMNKELQLPRLIKRIAVISSPSAAGWGDFHHQLTNNPYSFAFNVELFEATMQGDDVSRSVIAALGRIASEIDKWDVVVIIRGGGAAVDLMGFDTLELAENVAQFPLPVITGIGHERDDTVIDMISHTRVKTPTAAAEMIIANQLDEYEAICQMADRLERGVKDYLTRANTKLDQKIFTLNVTAPRLVERHQHRLEVIETKLDSANPDNLLKLGYGIVRKNGKAVKDLSQIENGTELEITVANGVANVVVDVVEKHNRQ